MKKLNFFTIMLGFFWVQIGTLFVHLCHRAVFFCLSKRRLEWNPGAAIFCTNLVIVFTSNGLYLNDNNS